MPETWTPSTGHDGLHDIAKLPRTYPERKCEQTFSPEGVTKSLRGFGEIGAGEGARTLDPDLGKVVLYH